jgi:hypothetical protein
MNGINDPFREIREGVRAAVALSFDKLLRLGYSRVNAKARLRELVRDAVNQLDE